MSKITTRTATDEDFDIVADFDEQIFGEAWPAAEREALRPTLELDRFRLGFDGTTLVGVAGLYSQELTVPGGSIVRVGGVTWVAVAPTHRRQGLLTTLMGEMHDDVDAHDEPLAILTASEGGIYDRFGYGVASHRRIVEIDRRRTQVRTEGRPLPGDVMMTTFDDERLVGIFDRYRRRRVGEIRRSPEQFALMKLHHGAGITVVIHDDGYAAWKITPKWNDGHPEHEMNLLDMVAITPAAHVALWHAVLSVDLVGPIRSFDAVALDDALPHLLTDPRALRTTNLNDMMWVHIRKVGSALAVRTYATIDEFVIEVDLGDRVERWRVSGGTDGADCRKVRSRPDLTMDRASLGAIHLGGVRPSILARAGRIKASKPDAIRRADAFFATDRLPHCSTGF